MLDLADPLRGLTETLLGQVLPGSEGRRYPLQQLIGEGGQGWVFKATWNGSVDVVVKVLRPDAATKEHLVRFQREAHVLRMLSQQATPNPHVVRFFDHAYAHIEVAASGKAWDLPFTVLELVEGETLEKALEGARPPGLGLERARRILRHIVLALQDVHAQNVVHRDLKPSNILLTKLGSREIAKVTDFGLAKLLDPGMQRTTQLVGATVGYAPPEQFEEGNRRVGRHTDVFSLAAIFYELVTGQAAFPFPPNAHPLIVLARILTEKRPAFARVMQALPPELAERPDVVAALDVEMARALSPEPSQRHPTVTDLYTAIEGALEALSNAPSLPLGRPSAEIIIRASALPAPLSEDPGIVPTVRAGSVGKVAPATRAPRPTTASGASIDTSTAVFFTWQCVTTSLGAGTFHAIAVSSAGGRAVALGAQGPVQWTRGQWARLDVPAGVDTSPVRAVGWLEDSVLLAGASSIVVAIEPGAPPKTWKIDAPGVSFHGIFADPAGVVLTGERPVAAVPTGVVAEILLGTRGGSAWGLTDVPGTGPLRAGVRLGPGILACGDGGMLASVPSSGDRPRARKVCEPQLVAVTALEDGTAAAVGGGAFTFRVWPTLDVQLEGTQTQRDLFALAQGPGGAVFSAGASGRVLRREARGWIRVGADGTSGRVLALHASGHRLLAFCDDGSVFEGAPRRA
jgi:serine/threonine-protein kinase